MDIEQLREAHKKNLAEREQKQKALDEARAAMKKVTDGAEARGDGALSADEVKAHTEARDKATALVAEIKALDEARAETEQRIDDWEASEAARAAAEESAKRYGGTERVERVNEPDLYRKGGEHSFFSDIYRMRYDADPMATERIMRHQRVHDSEARAVGTSAFAGLVVPQYLTEDYAAVAREGRPLADFIGARPLPPEGMTLNVPRGDTGTLVNSQSTQNNNVSEQDVGNTDIVVPVVTIAGQQNMSRQSIDRGRNTDDEVMQDLAEAYAARQDKQVINGTGANGQHLGILGTTNVNTITVVSTDGVTQVRQIAGAISSVHSGRFMPPNVIVVHPRRWAYWSQSTDSQGRPIVTPNANGPQNAFGVGDLVAAKGIVGTLYGLPVLADPNIPTTLSYDVTQSSTTDPIIVTKATDLRLYEDSPVPRRVRFEETLAGQLTVKIVAFDYSAFTAGRYPTATVVLAGSGLTTPVFGA